MDCKRIQSGSSSSRNTIWKYDVFLSFRGEDTRNNFTGHLFQALHYKGIVTFKDDIKLTKGEDISTELLQAIKESQILIVVFSVNYASSKWCLQELATIVDCNEGGSGQTILPIFYDVNPSEVRRQSGNYEEAFVKHEERFKDNLVMVQTWRKALTQVANLSGYDVNHKPQHEQIGDIVKQVSSILSHNFLTLSDDIVGMQSPLEELEKLLRLHSNDDVGVVGICGMGGIGKSTLASNLYCRIANQFHASCLIDDISKLFRDNNGPIEVQKQILRQTLNEETLQLSNSVVAANLMQTRLRHKKVLIVLDNVDNVQQLDNLVVKCEWLGAGSRIIITSRDEHILKEYQVDNVFKVQLLSYRDALELFCRKAFKCGDIVADYIDLTNEALSYANGNPLAIKVLSSLLVGRDVSEWRSALVRLRENPEKDIMDVLRISYESLRYIEKEIFLDISCFFSGDPYSYVENFLNIRGFHPEIGIKVLVEKSLVTIDKIKRCITMHDLLKELGRSIVRETSPKEPRKWSRLWDSCDLLSVLQENMEAEDIEAIFIENYEDEFAETMRVDSFSKMFRLKMLKLFHGNRLNFSGSLDCLSRELRYLSWVRYPFKHLPPKFKPHNLIELDLRDSSIKQLWKHSKLLPHLKNLDLSGSKDLIKLPDLRDMPNLEYLNLEGCIKLVEIVSSVGYLTKLVCLNLRGCKNLVCIPNSIIGLSSLKHLNLFGCSNLFKNHLLGSPKHAEHVDMLEINGTSIQQQSTTSSILKIVKSHFHCFYSGRHEESIGFLWPSLPHFLCLEFLDLSFCNLVQIPDAIGWLRSLAWLYLRGNNFVTLPSSIKELSKLKRLNLEHCKKLKSLPELPLTRSNTDFHWVVLNMFNCPNLINIKKCYNIVFSLMIRLLQVHMESSLHNLEIHIVIPGSEIPRWFNKQNAGSSISMDVTPYIHDENCIGVAFCATVLTHDDTSSGHEQWDSSPVTGVFVWLSHRYGFHVELYLRKGLITVESNDLLLIFFTREAFIEVLESRGIHDTNSGVELVISILYVPGVKMEVENCGYHWVFKEDLEKFKNPNMTHSGNSLVDNRKFLTAKC